MLRMFSTPPRQRPAAPLRNEYDTAFRFLLCDALIDCISLNQQQFSDEEMRTILNLTIDDEQSRLNGEPSSAPLDTYRQILANLPLLRMPRNIVMTEMNDFLPHYNFNHSEVRLVNWINTQFATQPIIWQKLQAGLNMLRANLNVMDLPINLAG